MAETGEVSSTQNTVNQAARELFLKSKKILADGRPLLEDFKVEPTGGIINTAQFKTMEANIDRIMGKTSLSKDQIAVAKDAFTKAQLILSFSELHANAPGRFPFPKQLETSPDPRVSRALVALLSKNVSNLAEEPGAEKRFVMDAKELDKSPLPDAIKSGVRGAMGTMGFKRTEGGTDVAIKSGVAFVTELARLPNAGK